MRSLGGVFAKFLMGFVAATMFLVVPLRWVDLTTGEEETLIRVNTQQPCDDSVMRVDPHPAWDRTWRYITFNAYVGGTRRVFVADMRDVIP